MLFRSLSFASEAAKTPEPKISKDYTASEKTYGNQKIGIVSFKGRCIIRIVSSPQTKDSVIARANKIAIALNTNVPNRDATQKISLTTSANVYHVACDKKPLFDYYPEDVAFNGVSNARLLKSWIANINRIMDL